MKKLLKIVIPALALTFLVTKTTIIEHDPKLWVFGTPQAMVEIQHNNETNIIVYKEDVTLFRINLF